MGGERGEFNAPADDTNLGGSENINTNTNGLDLVSLSTNNNKAERTEPVAATADESDQTTDAAESAVEVRERQVTPAQGVQDAAQRFDNQYSDLQESFRLTGDPDANALNESIAQWVDHHAQNIARAAGAAAGAGYSAVFGGIIGGAAAGKALETIFPRNN